MAQQAGRAVDEVQVVQQAVPGQQAPQQQQQQMEFVVRQMQQLFPDVEEAWVREHYLVGVIGLANHVLEHPNTVPRKAKRRMLPAEPSTPGSPQAMEINMPEDGERLRILTAQRAYVMTLFELAEFRSANLSNMKHRRETVCNLIANAFPRVHLVAVRKVVDAFQSNFAPAYAVIWYKTLGVTDWNFQHELPRDGNNVFGDYHCDLVFPLIKSLRPKRQLPTEIPADVQHQVDLIVAMQEEVEAIGGDPTGAVSPLAAATFECAICFEERPVDQALTCTDADEHSFCLECVRGHASAAAESAATAGTGLKCMETGCDAVLPWAAVRRYVPPKLRSRLSERFMVENVNCAGLDLERCKYCNYAVEMEVSKTQNKVFQCARCESEHCRLCGRDWDDVHIGLKCDEVAEKDGDMARHKYEDELSEVVIRRCPSCRTPFDKDEGCNKMTCRCGMTQCYLCRQARIDYTHFCEHVRDPRQPNGKCQQCDKPCLLWVNPAARDAQALAEIEAKAKQDKRLVGQLDKLGPIGGVIPRRK